MAYSFHGPDARRIAQGIEHGQRSDYRAPLAAMRQPVRSSITDVYAGITMPGAWFAEIDWPGGIAAAADESFWFTLRRIQVGEGSDSRPPFGFTGATMQLGPTDNTAARVPSSGTARAWGSADGEGAAIVIGRNLGLSLGWSVRRYAGPGLELGASAPFLLSGPNPPEYIISQHFPPGAYGGASIPRLEVRERFLPTCIRMAQSDVLTVSLVLRRANLSGIAAGKLCGFARVDLHAMELDQSREWTT